ncbi:hypothetical protein SEA_LUCKYLEO_42 [Gordonia phage LuckyLeo]|nr:hypothetical protein SEA_LUCKYLEO_42 [Gordonia phage LuckyLeo]
MRFDPISDTVDGNQTCDFELDNSYVCGREAINEVLHFEQDPDGDFSWCEYRCPLHSVEAIHVGVESKVDQDKATGESILIQSFIAFGWRRGWGYVVWRGDSREGGWVGVSTLFDKGRAVELLGTSENLRGY